MRLLCQEPVPFSQKGTIMTNNNANNNANKMLTTRDDLKRMGIKVSNVTLLRWEARGRFPRRIRMAGTTVAWFMSEIQDWLIGRR